MGAATDRNLVVGSLRLLARRCRNWQRPFHVPKANRDGFRPRGFGFLASGWQCRRWQRSQNFCAAPYRLNSRFHARTCSRPLPSTATCHPLGSSIRFEGTTRRTNSRPARRCSHRNRSSVAFLCDNAFGQPMGSVGRSRVVSRRTHNPFGRRNGTTCCIGCCIVYALARLADEESRLGQTVRFDFGHPARNHRSLQRFDFTCSTVRFGKSAMDFVARTSLVSRCPFACPVTLRLAKLSAYRHPIDTMENLCPALEHTVVSERQHLQDRKSVV